MNNGKKYLIVASGVLIVLMFGVFILQSLLSKGTAPGTVGPSPTLNPYQYKGGYPRPSEKVQGNGKTSSSSSATSAQMVEQKAKSQLEQIKRLLPLETDDYVVKYSPNLDKLVVTRKTPEADGAFNDWLIQNNLQYLANNPVTTIYSDKTMEEVQTPYTTDAPIKTVNAAINFFSLILNPAPPAMLKLSPSPTPKPTATPTPAGNNNQSSSTSYTPPKEYGGYVYYSQCHGQYDNYPLAPGCTVCKAGCGPTTVAMILSTYVDKKYTPPVVVEIYKDIGAAACGTGLGYAKSVLSSHGVRTSDYIIPYTGAQHDVKDVADDLRSYINNGWTIFVLAAYPGGHYFWMTDISQSGNVMAFDPYYGMDQTPPINENVRYPYPKYLAAFGVKKS